MVSGICVNCGKPTSFANTGCHCETQGCENFGKLYCYKCTAKMGFAKKPVCAKCGRMMRR
jgi:hypothetical protein